MSIGTKSCHITTDIQRESLHMNTVDTQKVLLSSLQPDRKYQRVIATFVFWICISNEQPPADKINTINVTTAL